MLRRAALLLGLLGLLSAVAAAPAVAQTPSCKTAPCAGDYDHAAVILSYWRGRHLARLVRAIERSGLPAGAPLDYGNYWGAGQPSEPKRKGKPKPKVPGRMAPIFPLYG